MINTQEFTASLFYPDLLEFLFFSSDRRDLTTNWSSSKVESFAQLFVFSCDHSANVVVVTTQHPF